MAKINIPPIKGGFNLSQINNAFKQIADELNDKVHYRDNPEGEPNQIKSDVDMNSKRIYNLPKPTEDHEAARYEDIKGIESSANKAHEQADRAEAEADRAEREADRAFDAAVFGGADNLKVYETLALATAAAKTLPDGQVVDVMGEDIRYIVQSGMLSFQKNLNQLAADLALGSGVSLVGYGDTNVAQALEDVEKAIHVSRDAENLLSSLTRGIRATRFKTAMDLGQRDVYLLMQGDSTGNESFEFFYQAVLKICDIYPNHRVIYRLWNPTTEVWDITFDRPATGSAKTLRIHNGSMPGGNPIYWHGRLAGKAYYGFQFDMVMLNFGLNTSTDTAIQKSSIASGIYTILRDQPNAEVVLNIQPPDYTDDVFLQRSQLRSDAQRQIASEFGVSVSDVFTLFTKLVKQSGVDAWYVDKIHPNAAGSLKWAEFAVGSFLWTCAEQKAPSMSPMRLPNAGFSRWLSASSPAWWVTSTSVTRNAAAAETGLYASEVAGWNAPGNTGIFFIEATDIFRSFERASRVVIAARVSCTGTSETPGTVYVSSGVSGSGNYIELRGANNGFQGIGSGGYRWAFLEVPREFYYAKNNLRIGIFSGQNGEKVIVDRVLLSGDYGSLEGNGTSGFSTEYQYADDAFSVSANSSVARNVGGDGMPLAQPGAKIQVDTFFAMPLGITLTATVTGDKAVRISVINTTGATINIPAGGWVLTIS